MSHVMPPTAGATPVGPAVTASVRTEAVQRVVKVRRDYNSWVARETMEDYALRYTPERFRKWSTFRVANTAFGAASFLILEAVGATLLVQYGFVNAAWAILATGLIIFLAGLPVSVYAARRGHGPAHAGGGLRLHRLDDHVADLRLVHLHLLRARGRGDGVRAGPGA